MLKNPRPLLLPSIFILQLFLLHGNDFNAAHAARKARFQSYQLSFLNPPPSFPFFLQTNTAIELLCPAPIHCDSGEERDVKRHTQSSKTVSEKTAALTR